MHDPNEPLEEKETAALVRAGLDGPNRPLRADQVDALVRRAQLRWQTVFPLWAAVLFTAGLAIIGLVGGTQGWVLRSLFDLIWLLPLANLALSPLAAGLIIYRIRNHKAKGARDR